MDTKAGDADDEVSETDKEAGAADDEASEPNKEADAEADTGDVCDTSTDAEEIPEVSGSEIDESDEFTDETERQAALIIDDAIESALYGLERLKTSDEETATASTYAVPFSEDSELYASLNERRQGLFETVLDHGRNWESFCIRESEYGSALVVDALTIDPKLKDYDPYLSSYFTLRFDGNDVCESYFDPDRDANFTVDNGSITMEEIADKMALFDAVVDRIVSKMPDGLSTFRKYYYLAAVVTSQCEYNIEPRNADTAYGCLIGGEALCEGYAKAYWVLCRAADLSCYLCDGYGKQEGHEWNMIELETGSYHVDTTWSSKYEPDSQYWFWYFACTEEENTATGHTNESVRTATGTPWDY